MELNTKEIRYVHANVVTDEKAIDLDSKRINFIVSSEIVDRSCEVVEAKAVFDAIHRKSEFVDNPICLACHLHRLENGMPPAIGYWDTETAKLKNNRVEMALQFDIEYDLGEKYWIVYKNRTMRAVSIGFRILDYRVEDRNGTRVFVSTKIELVEISCVAVGCNKQALAKLKELGIGDEAQTQTLLDQIAKLIDAKLTPITEQLDEIKSLYIPESDVDLSWPELKEAPSDLDDDPGQQVLSALKNVLTESDIEL